MQINSKMKIFGFAAILKFVLHSFVMTWMEFLRISYFRNFDKLHTSWDIFGFLYINMRSTSKRLKLIHMATFNRSKLLPTDGNTSGKGLVLIQMQAHRLVFCWGLP